MRTAPALVVRLEAMSKATAHANIALVKYWGKRESERNLPAAGSLSCTLGNLTTTTSVEPRDDGDLVQRDGVPTSDAFAARVTRFLDRLADELGAPRQSLHVETRNDFPTAAGLASSASGFAALTVAASHAMGAKIDDARRSSLARLGSGSAARSIHGGWVRLDVSPDDTIAHQIAPASHWDLRCVVLTTQHGPKDVSSTVAMNRTAQTSAYYDAWVASVDADLRDAQDAVRDRDFEKLARVAERSCLRMHASAMAAEPGILFWTAGTVELIHRVRALRRKGTAAFFTIDAGPHVKVFCPPAAVPTILDMSDDVVVGHIVSECGGPAKVLA